jgi:hypothetical protein
MKRIINSSTDLQSVCDRISDLLRSIRDNAEFVEDAVYHKLNLEDSVDILADKVNKLKDAAIEYSNYL